MKNLKIPAFNYSFMPAVKFASGLASEIGEELKAIGAASQVLIISDPGVIAAGLGDTVTASLKKQGVAVDLFNDLKGETSAASIDAATETIRACRPSAVIGLGGGSALDVAKMATVVAAADHSTESYALMRRPLPPRAAKLVMLPTTAGTGAEVTRTAVFTDSRGHKVWAWGDALAADLVILDPALTVSLPHALTAATGLDAMVHAIEACTVKSSHPFVQANGLHAIRLIYQHLAGALERPQDLNARANLLTASTLAGLAIDGAGTGLAHSIGHALGTIAGIHHGRAVALALDVIFPKNATTAINIHAEIAAALGVQVDKTAAAQTAKMGAQAFGGFIRRTGIELSLKPDGLSPKDVGRLVDAIYSEENLPMIENNCYSANESAISEFARQLLSR
ncbi:MAG: iron-containing alcohol dehydrogenase [Desulfobacterales bacterium]|jgi:alcohol dehydrogenase class IV